MRHLLGEATKRTVFRRGERLTGDDVNGALEALGDERCLGHPRRELVAPPGGGASLPPRELRLRDVEAAAAARSLSNALVEPSLGLRWLSVDGRDAREHDGDAAEGPPPWARLAPGAPAPGGALGREQELPVAHEVRGLLEPRGAHLEVRVVGVHGAVRVRRALRGKRALRRLLADHGDDAAEGAPQRVANQTLGPAVRLRLGVERVTDGSAR